MYSEFIFLHVLKYLVLQKAESRKTWMTTELKKFPISGCKMSAIRLYIVYNAEA